MIPNALYLSCACECRNRFLSLEGLRLTGLSPGCKALAKKADALYTNDALQEAEELAASSAQQEESGWTDPTIDIDFDSNAGSWVLGRDLRTEPGDATVHYGCGLHAGPAPTGPERRRTLYIQHYSPRAAELIGPYQGYNQIMPGYGEGDIPNIDEVQARQREAAP